MILFISIRNLSLGPVDYHRPAQKDRPDPLDRLELFHHCRLDFHLVVDPDHHRH
jgi:hypothetical protein